VRRIGISEKAIYQIVIYYNMMNCKTAYDLLATDYDRYFSDARSKRENELLFNHIKRAIPYLGRVFDVGCGTGLALEYLDIPPNSYVGMDISTKMLNIAQQKFQNHHFIKGDAQEHIPNHQYFSTILSLFGSFSYCLHPQRLIRQIERIAAPNSKICIMVFSHHYRAKRDYIINQLKYSTVPFKTYSIHELKKLFHGILVKTDIYGLSKIDEEWPQKIYSDPKDLNSCYHIILIGSK